MANNLDENLRILQNYMQDPKAYRPVVPPPPPTRREVLAAMSNVMPGAAARLATPPDPFGAMRKASTAPPINYAADMTPIPEEAPLPVPVEANGLGVPGAEKDAEFWRRKQNEWNRLDAIRTMDKAMAGRGDIMNLWKEAVKMAGIGSSTGGIKLARQSQNAIALLNHLLDAQGKAEANAIAGAGNTYGHDIQGFGAEATARHYAEQEDIARQKLPEELAGLRATADYHRALAEGVPNKSERAQLALEEKERQDISRIATTLMNQGTDPEEALYTAQKWRQEQKAVQQGGALRRPQSVILNEIRTNPTMKAQLLEAAKTRPDIQALVEANKELFK